MENTSNIIDKNWKSLIKPNKLEITSNEDKSVAKVIAEPLEKVSAATLDININEIAIIIFFICIVKISPLFFRNSW